MIFKAVWLIMYVAYRDLLGFHITEFCMAAIGS